jgi:hypothetical protein
MKYWSFSAVCLLVAVVIVRLVLRERMLLQGSLSYLAFLTLLGLMAVFPQQTMRLSSAMGFTLLSNFFFAVAIGLLALLHLRALVTISKVHMRSIALTQELAILQERLDRVIPPEQKPERKKEAAPQEAA